MYDQLLRLFQGNPILAGGAGMAIVGWILVQARTIPLKLFRIIRDQFVTTMTIYTEDVIFRRLDYWLSRHPSTEHSRRFGVTHWHNRRTDADDFLLTPGSGSHLIKEVGRYFLVHRHVEDKTTQEDFAKIRRQTITIATYGRSTTPLKNLIAKVQHIDEDRTAIPILIWQGHGFTRVERRTKRPLDTIYINAGIKQHIIDDLTKFFAQRADYHARGIPYRRGYMLEGPPGTGKSTLIFVLACLFDRPVYIINLASISNDSELLRAINEAGRNFVVIEDIDAIKVAEEREGKESSLEVRVGEASRQGITTSGLLNAIDGIASAEGRVLFITSNRPDVLDSALIRPGRVDVRYRIDYAKMPEALAMYRKFFPEASAQEQATFEEEIAPLLPISPAALQNRLLGESMEVLMS
ncbi:cell division protein [Caulobacter phage CcrPW]|uniref:Cell division protein n=1 Tax=Caulobacter phage CcrPW TaxID=2283271 RepID=A0A385ED47_9CAUD|nr:cell division protein [Caulobacter phage CcrPW]AXQ68782.1 cell division protein [Caulobacter phage CcrPW]